ncbi:MAG: right-handed parallel beta-helix repeat-containing protein [Isosphaeraceae bacterium]
MAHRRRSRRANPCVEGFEARFLLATTGGLLTVSDASVLQNPDGTVSMDFDVTIDLNLETTVTVFYYTTDGSDRPDCATAVSGVDYLGVPQDAPLSVTFPINTTTETVSIPVPGNYRISPTKCFTLHAFRVDTQPQLDATGVGSILNNNSLVVSNTNTTGYGSLFGAIQSVNTSDLPGVPTISFAIVDQSAPAPFTIFPDVPLPVVDRPANIDATTQPGYAGKPLVILNGSQVSNDGLPIPDADALVLNAPNSAVRGLGIQSWTGDGVQIGFIQPLISTLPPSQAVIERNEITSVGGSGVRDILGGGNVIRNNVFKGLSGDGVALGDGAQNVVTANQILGVLGSGISTQLGASQTTITNNTISDPAGNGILLAPGTDYTVQGNTVTRPGVAGVQGKGLSGHTVIRSNTVTAAGDAGIVVSDGNGVSILSNTITDPAAGGIFLSFFQNGTVNANGISIAPNAGGVEAPPPRSAILLNESPNNTLDGNNVNGSLLAGIELVDASDGNRLTRNIVAGAASSGLVIDGSNGNMIASNTFGRAGRGNGEDGITVLGASSGNLIGMPGAGNLVYANALVGIRLGDGLDGGPTGNVVRGNIVGAGPGTPATGKGNRNRANGPSRSGLGNLSGGIFLDNASNNVIGGAGAAGNVVADNSGPGVQITLGSRNVVLGNLIGLTSGNAAASRQRGSTACSSTAARTTRSWGTLCRATAWWACGSPDRAA